MCKFCSFFWIVGIVRIVQYGTSFGYFYCRVLKLLDGAIMLL